MNKKIFLLLALVAALTLVFVACTEPETPEETTPTVTEAPTDAETPTEEPTDAETPTEPVETPTEAPTTEEPTEEPTEPETLPYKTPEEAGKVGVSFDTFYVNGEMFFAEDGNADAKLTEINDTVSFKTGDTVQSMMLRGWIGFGQAIDSFGYYIDSYDFIYDAAFTAATEDGVKAAGGEHASRFEITIPLTGLNMGDHTVGFVAKLADGTVVRMRAELTVGIEKTVWNGSGIVNHQSFDQLYLGDGAADNSTDTNIFFAPGASASWDYVANVTDSVTTLTYWGWVGLFGEVGQFGYQINGGEAIFNDAWTHATEQGVIDAAVNGGADTGSRMKITIDVTGLTGENTLTVLYKNAEGVCVVLSEIALNVVAEPYKVDLSEQPTIGTFSGYRTNEENPGTQFQHVNAKNDNEIANNGGAFMFFDQDSILTLNNMDLSQYSKVTLRVATGTQDSLILSFNVNGEEIADAEMRVIGENHKIHEVTFDLSSVDATDATVTLTVNSVGICPGVITEIVFLP